MSRTRPAGDRDAVGLGIAADAVSADGNQGRVRILAALAAARFHGFEPDRDDFHGSDTSGMPSPPELAEWLREARLRARASRLNWRQLMKLTDPAPVVLLFNDGSAGLLTGVDALERVALIKDPRGRPSDLAVPVGELRLSEVWAGEVILIRKPREVSGDRDIFNIA
ncbi:MAG: hypothetical protein ACREFO_00340 [Acetobacteraceae bacterium]